MIPHDFHTEAEVEFVEAALFYEGRVSGLGSAFVAEVERAVTFARSNPEAGAPLGGKVRRVLVRRFPYSVIYRREAEHLLILAIAHQRRRPGIGARSSPKYYHRVPDQLTKRRAT